MDPKVQSQGPNGRSLVRYLSDGGSEVSVALLHTVVQRPRLRLLGLWLTYPQGLTVICIQQVEVKSV